MSKKSDNKNKSLYKIRNENINTNTNLNKVYYNNSIKENKLLDFFNLKRKNIINKKKFSHNIPSVKEWNNNVYYYNTDKLLISKYKLIYKYIKNYFTIFSKYKFKHMSRKRRKWSLRAQIKKNRKSLRKILISKPEIKQTNDKVIVTIYTFNQIKRSQTKKIYGSYISLKQKNITKHKSLLKSYLYTTKRNLNINNIQNLKFDKIRMYNIVRNLNNIFNDKYNKLSNSIRFKTKLLYLKNKIYKTSNKSATNKNNLKINKYKKYNTSIKYNKRINQSGYRKNLRYLYNKKYRANLKKYRYKNIYFRYRLMSSLIRNKFSIKNLFFWGFLKKTLLKARIQVKIIKLKRRKRALVINNKKVIFKNKKILKRNIANINNILFNLLIICYSNKRIIKLFKKYKRKHIKLWKKKYLSKYALRLYYLYMYSLNNYIYHNFTKSIKFIINKVYNKKVILNIVNLKQLHVNTDILIGSIANKLKKRKIRLLKVLKRSLRLVKLPKKSNINYFKKPLVADYKNKELISFSNTNFLLKKDLITQVLKNIFKVKLQKLSQINQNNNKNRINILNSIKYKWIKGIKLEAKGRLTKRYTASKSIFKYRYKGDLKYRYKSIKLPYNLIRGDLKPNMEYGFKESKRRVGAFGIKGWISTI